MIGPLHRFIEELRARGVSLSPAEVLDAARAADAVGPEDRARFRAALATTLAKDRRSLAHFHEAFEGFFAAPPREGSDAGKGTRAGAGGDGGSGGGSGPGGRPAPPRSDAGSHDDPPSRGTPPALRPSQRPGASRRTLRALPASMVREELGKSAPMRRPSARTDKEDLRAGRAERAPKTGAGEPPATDARRTHARTRLSRLLATEETRAPASPVDPRRRDLASPMTPADERELAREIPRVLDEIRLRPTRRTRRASRGRVSMKRAIRENLATGGVPFRIPMRRPRRRRARAVLVVDVSWSVATASGLFLLLAMEVLRLDRRARVFFFVDHPVEATDVVRGWMRRGPDVRSAVSSSSRSGSLPARASVARRAAGHAPARGRGAATGVVSPFNGRSFGSLLNDVPGLDPGGASDYGRAFWALSEGPLRVLARDAVLVVLGDARTNRFDPLPWAFEAIAARARRVLWLAPEPRARWGTGDSALLRYLPFCDVAVEARDLEGLAHGVREMVACL